MLWTIFVLLLVLWLLGLVAAYTLGASSISCWSSRSWSLWFVLFKAGARRWVAEVCPGQSYLSSGDPRVHFGLGAIERIDELRIDWPDGLSERFTPEGLNRHVTLVRGKVGRAFHSLLACATACFGSSTTEPHSRWTNSPPF